MLIIVIETPKGINGCKNTLFEPVGVKISTAERIFSCMHIAIMAKSIQPKFGTSTRWADVVTHLKWYRKWFRGFGGVGVQIFAYLTDFIVGF